jgi:hypothetical protein
MWGISVAGTMSSQYSSSCHALKGVSMKSHDRICDTLIHIINSGNWLQENSALDMKKSSGGMSEESV